jgi:cytochrome oxidase Cu insertion factor (SCO1/SenC/PrrC family)
MSFTMKSMRRALAVAALVGAMFCVICSSALADGDPASDYLLNQQVFVLLQQTGTPPAQKALSEVVAKANKAGYPIRVAVISSEYDLGSVSVLWGKPRTYARFLGIELSLAYKGLLLVAMPSGFGINWPGHSTAAVYEALAGVKVPAGEIGTITAAQAAVQRLVSAGDVQRASGAKAAAGSGATKVSASSSSSHTASSGSGVSASTALLIGAAVMLAIAFGAALLESRRRAAPAPGEAPAPGDAPAPQGSATPPLPVAAAATRASGIPLKWALPRMAALFAVAVAVPIVAVGLLRQGGPQRPSQDSAHAVTPETPFTWSEGQRIAPNFTLVNQTGQAISPAAYHGRPLIITFIDPLCRNLCPLEAKVLNEADERLPVHARPQIIAVSVDIYADTHTDLMLDFRRWGLVPQWQWAVGTPAQLQAVWKRYYAEVEVQTKHIAGTTVHYITHSEMAYVVDGKGYERALFSWPFNAKAVQKTLLQIERS